MNFNFKQDYTLENEVVLLRPLEKDDFSFLESYSVNEPELWQHSPFGTGADGLDNLKRYIDNALKNRLEEREYAFIVYDKRKDKYIGSTRFYDIQLNNKSLQLGYTWYGKEFQGAGLNKHCKYLLLEFAFEQMLMKRVEFRADSSNERSIHAMKKLGCKVEGILRSTAPKTKGDGRRDSIVLSILEAEWLDEVKENRGRSKFCVTELNHQRMV